MLFRSPNIRRSRLLLIVLPRPCQLGHSLPSIRLPIRSICRRCLGGTNHLGRSSGDSSQAMLHLHDIMDICTCVSRPSMDMVGCSHVHEFIRSVESARRHFADPAVAHGAYVRNSTTDASTRSNNESRRRPAPRPRVDGILRSTERRGRSETGIGPKKLSGKTNASRTNLTVTPLYMYITTY